MKRHQIIDDAERLLLNNTGKSQKQVLDALKKLLTEFDTQGGKIQFNAETTRLINQAAKRIYEALQKSGYDSRVKEYLKDFEKIKESAIAEQKITNRLTVAPRNLTNIQRSAIQQTTNILLGNGLDAKLVQPVKDILLSSASSGMTIPQAELRLRETILGNEERLGSLERYVTQISRDAISQYDGMMQERIAKDYELDGVSYEGSIIKDSRPQCIRWAGMGELPISDLSKEIDWAYSNGSGMIPGTTKDNFMIYRGGYNCRHFATAIRLDDSRLSNKNVTAKTIEDAIENQDKWIKTLPQEEKEIVFRYTEGHFGEINETLRGGGKLSSLSDEQIEKLRVVLEKAPKFEGQVYRGMALNNKEYQEFISNIKEGGILSDNGFMSTSYNSRTAKSFTAPSNIDTNKILLNIKSKTGVMIDKLSELPDEKEVLLNLKSKFEVKKITISKHPEFGYDIVEIDLIEL